MTIQNKATLEVEVTIRAGPAIPRFATVRWPPRCRVRMGRVLAAGPARFADDVRALVGRLPRHRRDPGRSLFERDVTRRRPEARDDSGTWRGMERPVRFAGDDGTSSVDA